MPSPNRADPTLHLVSGPCWETFPHAKEHLLLLWHLTSEQVTITLGGRPRRDAWLPAFGGTLFLCSHLHLPSKALEPFTLSGSCTGGHNPLAPLLTYTPTAGRTAEVGSHRHSSGGSMRKEKREYEPFTPRPQTWQGLQANQ